MKLETNLPGRLRNTQLPQAAGLLPLFEAVVNSIHAIEEAGLSGRDAITIEILRDALPPSLDLDDSKKKPGREATGEIRGFRITDNGIGFNDENMASFRTLDSDHKADKGCRGVGRLMWLKAFESAKVSSIYESGGAFLERSFTFDAESGVSEVESRGDESRQARETSITLDGFRKKYRDASPKTTKTIASNLFEHCLWYFVREGGAPVIRILDDGEEINLDDTYAEHMHSSAETERVDIKGYTFDLIHVKLRSHNLPAHVMALCAGNRLVKEEKLNGKVPGLFGRISDEDGAFLYACYVSSEFLDDCVRPERTGFDLAETTEPLFEGTDISLDDIRNKVVERASEHLAQYLTESRAKSKDRVSSFISMKAPRYGPILTRIPEDELQVDPEISDKDLDLLLHKHLAQIEGQLREQGHDLMNPATGENLEEYEERLSVYLKTVEDIKKSDLANYVSHRKVILDLFGKALEKGDDGKYSREDLIHSLIMPMRKESREVLLDGCNLWLIDERLAFHDYLASDKTLASAPITGCEDKKEPDLLCLNVFDNPILVSEEDRPPLASIVVVEIKRPMRDDVKPGVDHDPIDQALDYVKRIRAGKVTTRAGRPIPGGDQIPGYCYILGDLTPTFIDRCKYGHDLTPTSDGLGYFGYKSNLNVYVEVFSFDRLLRAAMERNRAFFDRLGLPT